MKKIFVGLSILLILGILCACGSETASLDPLASLDSSFSAVVRIGENGLELLAELSAEARVGVLRDLDILVKSPETLSGLSVRLDAQTNIITAELGEVYLEHTYSEEFPALPLGIVCLLSSERSVTEITADGVVAVMPCGLTAFYVFSENGGLTELEIRNDAGELVSRVEILSFLSSAEGAQ